MIPVGHNSTVGTHAGVTIVADDRLFDTTNLETPSPTKRLGFLQRVVPRNSYPQPINAKNRGGVAVIFGKSLNLQQCPRESTDDRYRASIRENTLKK
ncbi:hypothetical protein J6590_044416 [Homalodisca vitripennis]|nr:hypothetical protein J6590_044416 [Homalodisca vitripennis]